jgi:hypothetical protein
MDVSILPGIGEPDVQWYHVTMDVLVVLLT